MVTDDLVINDLVTDELVTMKLAPPQDPIGTPGEDSQGSGV